MTNFNIYTINIAVNPSLFPVEGLESDKPLETNTNYYLGKLIGKSEMNLIRTQKGKPDERISNCVLRNKDGIALIRVHNKKSYKIINLPEKTSQDVSKCVESNADSFPYSYVVIDYREEKCKIAIENSPVWNYDAKAIKEIFENCFKSGKFKSLGLLITVKEISISTEFEKFLDERTIDYGDEIESFTFQYVNLEKHPYAQIPEELTEEMNLYSKILEIHGAISGTNTVKLSQNLKKDKLYQLSHIVTMCCINGFDLSVRLRDYGVFSCKEERILAKFPMNDDVINNFIHSVVPKENQMSHDFVLSLWLDMVNEKIANNKYGKTIKRKPNKHSQESFL